MRLSRLKLINQSAVYHVLSRVTQQQQWLGLAERAYLMQLLDRVAAYCGVQVITFCLMSDHFNLLIRVPEKAPADAALDGLELIRRVEILYGTQDAEDMRTVWNQRETPAIAEEWNALRSLHHGRMHDLSVFMKLLKQRFTIWHNSQHDTLGTLWTERFASLLVESGEDSEALRILAAYVEMDPVRSGAVENPADYPFSGRWTATHNSVTSTLPDLTSLLGNGVRGLAFGTLRFILAVTGAAIDLARLTRSAYAVAPASDLYTGRRFRLT
jgi:putative transposase